MNSEWIMPTNIICGYFDSSVFGGLKISPERERTLFEIEYYLEGGKTTFSNGIAYPIKKDHIRISSPGEVGNSLLPFKTKYVKFHAEGELAKLLTEAPRYFRVYRGFEILSLMDEIAALSLSSKPNELTLYARLLSLLCIILKESRREEKGSSMKLTAVAKAKEYIKKNIGEPIRLSDIAGEVNLSPNYFHTTFTEVTGRTPHEYLVEYRVSTARELLLTTPLSLSEIAERCGFGNQQYMTSVFKARLGISPAKCRQDYMKDYLI